MISLENKTKLLKGNKSFKSFNLHGLKEKFNVVIFAKSQNMSNIPVNYMPNLQKAFWV